MNFFKKTSVAVVIALLVVALCCVWGYTRVNDQDPTLSTHYQPDRNSGESNLNYYLGWISDGARLFSADTIDTMARENLTLDNTYGSLVAVKTVSYLNGRDIQSYAEETPEASAWTAGTCSSSWTPARKAGTSPMVLTW